MNEKIKKYIWKLFFLIVLGVFALFVNYIYVSHSSSSLIFDSGNNIPKTKYLLFLGTPKYLPNGDINNYYKNRITSTIELYENHKVEKIIISADVHNKYGENEVELIKSDFIEEGVNTEDIILDNNGNSTWNSISFLEKESNINNVIIISQEFHLERALHIAQEKNINAIGYVAKGTISNKLLIREVLARVKMQIDIIKG